MRFPSYVPGRCQPFSFQMLLDTMSFQKHCKNGNYNYRIIIRKIKPALTFASLCLLKLGRSPLNKSPGFVIKHGAKTDVRAKRAPQTAVSSVQCPAFGKCQDLCYSPWLVGVCSLLPSPSSAQKIKPLCKLRQKLHA